MFSVERNVVNRSLEFLRRNPEIQRKQERAALLAARVVRLYSLPASPNSRTSGLRGSPLKASIALAFAAWTS
jgi:hypothetical protein